RPLCDPTFDKLFTEAQTQTLLGRLQQLRKKAGSDVQRLWLDVMIESAHRRLGQTAEAAAVTERIAGNPARLDARHGKNAAALIEEMRQSAARLEELHKSVQFHQRAPRATPAQ